MIKLKTLLEIKRNYSYIKKLNKKNQFEIDPPLTKDEILNIYKDNGIEIIKITRSKLNDGFFVYHPFGSAKTINTRKLISKSKNKSTYQKGKKDIQSDFIEDGNLFSIIMAIEEAKNRKR